ncbi:SusC/RagA family TonB-linked outer membrane protein [Wenyingzhuangia fucanilytica]|uniref:SusC/RagA family TonB-linked outer membrane protein n=2 Tax=Wenyingzhuangia fucanilytica TaxID=1790137 RepID=A0A1B1Y5P8_9FLAO|nr:SusC/RagA family TonB-linked outer membrane protein [Wenyingzhuangia fucanilytica]
MLSISVFSQVKTITGKVTDEFGEPIVGASLFIKQTSKGSLTDFDGFYSIKAKRGDIIIFSYLGAESNTAIVGDSNVINVTLKKSAEELEEVVVVGYGAVKKSDLTGSVSSVKAEDIMKTQSISLDNALAGRAAGVIVTSNSGTPGAGANITIRGISTISSSEPLYVIDGIPMENESLDVLSADTTGGDSMSPLSLISPEDIESIEILKDASATAIYGSRGSNGVVLVTTKTGVAGKGVVAVSHNYSIGTIPHPTPLLNANEFVLLDNELSRNSGTALVNPELLADAQAGKLKTTDWLSTVTSPSITKTSNLSFSGGNKDLRYLISTNFLDSKGMISNTDFKRIQTRINLDATVSEKVKVGTRITYAYVDSDSQSTNVGQNADGFGVGNIIRRVLEADPTKDIYQTIEPDEEDLIENPDAEPVIVNPLDYLQNNSWNTKQYQLLGSMYLNYRFSKSLYFKTSFNYQNRYSKQRFYQNREVRPGQLTRFLGWAKTGDSQNESISNSNELHFDTKFGKHQINSILGQSIEYRSSDRVTTDHRGFPNDFLTFYAPKTADTFFGDTVDFSESQLLSYFGRINYTYNKKYLFTLTGRYDGSSKFAINNKWAFFPAGAFAYKLSEEEFMKNIPEISQAKFRVSYGKTGNQSVRSFQSLSTLDPDTYVVGDGAGGETTTTVYYSSQIPNPNLKWESTNQFDVGLDLAFFKNRVTLTTDYYSKVTSDLLFNSNKVPAQSGQSNFVRNFGTIRSKGFELDLGLRVINNKNFSWNFKGNFSVGEARIDDLTTDLAVGQTLAGVAGDGTQRLINGDKVGTFYGFKRAGIAQFDDFVEFQGLSNADQINLYNSDRTASYTYIPRADGALLYNEANPSPGQQLFYDTNGKDGITEDDKVAIGNAQADMMFGIKNDFKIGNVDFSFFLDGQLGQEIANITNVRLLTFTGSRNASAVVKDSWSPENQNSDFPKLGSVARVFNDMYVENGSFVRLQNITIGYSFPKKVIAKMLLTSLRLNASLNNVYTFTNYSGFSPDVSAYGRNNLSLGHDRSGYPNTRRFVVGLNLSF